MELVHGGWSGWQDWSDCSASCGGGDQSRSRTCDYPSPLYGGKDCTEDGSTNSESKRCNENDCQSKNDRTNYVDLFLNNIKICLIILDDYRT